MKQKILSQLKTKYKDLGLSDKVLEAIAESIAAKNIEEDQIDSEVEGVGNLLKTFQSDADKRVTDAVNKSKTQPEKKDEQAAQPPKGGENQNTDITKAIQDAISPLVQEITALKAGNVAKTRQQILETKLENANPALKSKILKDFSRMKFESDEEFDTYVSETETDLADFSKQQNEQGLGGLGQPFRPSGGSTGKATEEEINAIADAIIK